MTERKEDHGAKAVEQAPDDADYLDMPRIYRRQPEARDSAPDELDCLMTPMISRCGRRIERPSLWARLRKWISGR